MRQASLGAQSLELLEEAKAIKAAQKKAKKLMEKGADRAAEVNKAQGKVAAGSKGGDGTSIGKGATEGALARWLVRAPVQDAHTCIKVVSRCITKPWEGTP